MSAARRVLLADAEGRGAHLRVTWHPEVGQFVVSTWHGDVCVGSVRLGPPEAARLLGLLAEGVASAAPREATGS